MPSELCPNRSLPSILRIFHEPHFSEIQKGLLPIVNKDLITERHGNIQRLATGIDFDRADASIEIVFAAAAACQKTPRFYRRLLYAFPIDVFICVFYRRFFRRFLYAFIYAFSIGVSICVSICVFYMRFYMRFCRRFYMRFL